MARASMKEAYRKFARNFSEAKRRQSAMTKRQRLRAMAAGEQMLGRRPTFKEWSIMVSTVGTKKEKKEDRETIEVLDWDDAEEE